MSEIIEILENADSLWENFPESPTEPLIKIQNDDTPQTLSFRQKGEFVLVLGQVLGQALQRDVSIIAKPHLSPFYSYMFNVDIELTAYFPSDAKKAEDVERVKWTFLDEPDKQGEGDIEDLIIWMKQNRVRVFISVDGDFIDMKPYPEENPVTLQGFENDNDVKKIMQLTPYSF